MEQIIGLRSERSAWRFGELRRQPAEKSMRNATDDQIAGLLVRIISDGFNRSLGALEAAGAVDTKKMRRHYTGIGSRFYDMVTEQIVLTAKYAAPAVRQLFLDDAEVPDSK
jgi:hypothetical protein